MKNPEGGDDADEPDELDNKHDVFQHRQLLRPVSVHQSCKHADCDHEQGLLPVLLLVGWVVDGDHGEQHAGGGVGYSSDQRLPLAMCQQTKAEDLVQDCRTPNAASHPTI